MAINKYTLNLLQSCARWLAGRANTVWAKQFGYSTLMHDYSEALLQLREALMEGRDICSHCGGIIGAPLGRAPTALECPKCCDPNSDSEF